MAERPLRRILHVDDDADIRATAKVTLETMGGYEVESCDGGADALAKAPRFAPDLLLLDVKMPGMDGPAALQALRQLSACAAAPAIFMTAQTQPHEIAELRGLGALGVIGKPFDPLTLCSEVTALCHRRPR